MGIGDLEDAVRAFTQKLLGLVSHIFVSFDQNRRQCAMINKKCQSRPLAIQASMMVKMASQNAKVAPKILKP